MWYLANLSTTHHLTAEFAARRDHGFCVASCEYLSLLCVSILQYAPEQLSCAAADGLTVLQRVSCTSPPRPSSHRPAITHRCSRWSAGPLHACAACTTPHKSTAKPTAPGHAHGTDRGAAHCRGVLQTAVQKQAAAKLQRARLGKKDKGKQEKDATHQGVNGARVSARTRLPLAHWR
jgi:hypothetical protein